MTAARKRQPAPQLVALTWLDHQEGVGTDPTVWYTAEQIDGAAPATIRSVGWIMHEDDLIVVTVSQLANDGTFGGPMTIVKSCITKRVVLA